MKRKFTTQELILTGMLAAVAGVLMSMEISMPLMPPFYKLDFSDVPSIIALFTVGPYSAVCVEVIKIVIKLITVGTNSMYVGEFANLVGVVLFVVPIWLIYKKLGQDRKAAIKAMVLSLPIRIGVSCFINACITLPMYAKAMGMPLDELVRAVAAVNPAITNLTTFLVLATVPFNLVKIALNYAIGYFVYERLKALNIVRTKKDGVHYAS